MAKLRGLLWLGLSLGTVNLMISLHASIPRYFVERHLGVEELGIFSAMGYVALLGSPIVQALGNTVSPRLAKHYVEGQKVPFCRLLTKTVALGALFTTCGVLVCAVAGRLILTTLFRPEYAVHANVFPWIIFGTGLAQVAQLISYGATAARYLRAQMPLLLAAVLIVGLIGAWLIPRHGLTGAASAIIASAAALFVGNIIIVQYAIRNMNVRCESV
jgi:O-antigen/teichoic acid export membrane protein